MTKKMMRTKFILLFLAVGLAWTGSAAAINVPDGDFDTPALADGAWSYVADIGGAWSAVGGGGSPWVGNNYTYDGYDYPGMGHTGAQWVDLNGNYIHQALGGETYEEGVTYELSAYATTGTADQRLYLYFTDATNSENGWDGAITLFDSGPIPVPISDWTQYSAQYTATAADAGKTIGIALWGDGNTYADTVTLVRPGDIVEAVRPLEHASDVSVSETLEWKLLAEAEFTAEGYDLYFGTDPNILSPNYDWEKKIDNEDVTTWDPPDGPESGDMEFLTKYYWQVDVYEPNLLPGGVATVHVGRIWSFTTASPLPAVTTHPQGQVAVGGAAEFTVAGVNIENYEWWLSVDDSTDTPADDILQGSGPTMDTLTLSGVELGDEGYYYCVVSNDGGASTDKSNTARLITARLVGRWTFDAEDYGDSSDSDNTGIPTGDPTFAAGLVGAKALELDGNDFVAIDTVAKDLLANDITLSIWVKTTDANAELIACNTASYSNVIRLEVWDMVARRVYPAGSGTTTVNDDTWHLLTYVRNGSDDYIYVNGTEEYAGTADFNLAADNLWSIGQEWDGGATASDFLVGTVDDVRIYNYALPHDEVAELYVDVMGGYVCKKPLYYDMDGDCVVGISDFAALAAKWMDCNFVPVEDCP